MQQLTHWVVGRGQHTLKYFASQTVWPSLWYFFEYILFEWFYNTSIQLWSNICGQKCAHFQKTFVHRIEMNERKVCGMNTNSNIQPGQYHSTRYVGNIQNSNYNSRIFMWCIPTKAIRVSWPLNDSMLPMWYCSIHSEYCRKYVIIE